MRSSFSAMSVTYKICTNKKVYQLTASAAPSKTKGSDEINFHVANLRLKHTKSTVEMQGSSEFENLQCCLKLQDRCEGQLGDHVCLLVVNGGPPAEKQIFLCCWYHLDLVNYMAENIASMNDGHPVDPAFEAFNV